MSDAVNEANNLDVMSSVRRKVSNGRHGDRSTLAGVDKLVLTDSLRVDHSANNAPFTEKPILAESPGRVFKVDHRITGDDNSTNDEEALQKDGLNAGSETEFSEMDGSTAVSPAEGREDRAVFTTGQSVFGSDTGLDEDMLRDMISSIVREELQGDLGERITRNVRKLVRREIHRTMVSNDLG